MIRHSSSSHNDYHLSDGVTTVYTTLDFTLCFHHNYSSASCIIILCSMTFDQLTHPFTSRSAGTTSITNSHTSHLRAVGLCFMIGLHFHISLRGEVLTTLFHRRGSGEYHHDSASHTLTPQPHIHYFSHWPTPHRLSPYVFHDGIHYYITSPLSGDPEQADGLLFALCISYG
jgi:hypothetical protein